MKRILCILFIWITIGNACLVYDWIYDTYPPLDIELTNALTIGFIGSILGPFALPIALFNSNSKPIIIYKNPRKMTKNPTSSAFESEISKDQ